MSEKPMRIEMLIGLSFCVAFAAFIGWRILTEQSKQARSSENRANLRAIGQALQSYHQQHGCFPPAYFADKDGKPFVSWRVLILPQLGYSELLKRYRLDEPWNAPNNSQLLDQMPKEYQSPEDFDRSSNETSYLAIVSRYSSWPGPYSVTAADFPDGMALTYSVAQTWSSGISWMEPRDFGLSDLLSQGKEHLVEPFKGHEAARFLYADGSVVTVSSMIDRTVFRGFCTRGSAAPWFAYPGETEEKSVETSFPAFQSNDDFRRTMFDAHLLEPMVAGKNRVWCGTFQLAWNEKLNKYLGGPAKIVGDSIFAGRMNQQVFGKRDLQESSYLISSGLANENAATQLGMELNQRFPNNEVSLPKLNYGPDYLYLFAYLCKSLPFQFEFDDTKEAFVFRPDSEKAPVKAFGLLNHSVNGIGLRSQVKVMDYKNADDFIVSVSTKPKDQIVFAKVQPAKTLSETLEAVRKRIAEKSGKYSRPNMEPAETLTIPELAFSVKTTFKEIEGKKIARPNGQDWRVESAFQAIRFRLDKKGAELESWGGEVLEQLAEDEVFTGIRHFTLDKPFLLYITEPNAKHPYLIMWIENSELMNR